MKIIGITAILAALALSACESGSPPESFWRSECIQAGNAGGTPELDACVARKRSEHEAQ